MRYLQISVLSLLSFCYVLAVFSTWLGISPSVDLREYLSNLKTWIPILSVASVFLGIIAFVIGWDPQQGFLNWLRSKLIIPVFSSRKALTLCVIVALALIVLQVVFLVRFSSNPCEVVLSYIFSENYDAADRKIADSDLSADEIADLYIVNDSLRQNFFRESQSQDKSLSRLYYRYLSKRDQKFRSIWWRYAFAYGKASCLQVLEDAKGAVQEYQLARSLARWINDGEVRQCARKIAYIHFHDQHGVAGIPNKNERLRYIVSLISTDPEQTAQRMLGSSYYLLGEFSKAADTWNTLMSSIAPNDNVERKRILNNIGMAYTALQQHTLAMQYIQKGLTIPFDSNNEKERREQVRLLATKALSLVKQGIHIEALQVWSERESLKLQERSKGTSLIEAQIYSLAYLNEKNPVYRAKALNSLLLGVGQEPSSFVDKTPDAIRSLITQAELTFGDCYLGIVFPKQMVLQAFELSQNY